MKIHFKIIVTMYVQIMCVVLFMISNSTFAVPSSNETFWDVQKKGANIFNRKIIEEDIKAAKEYGIEFIRLAPDKFPSAHRDFLIGDADNYRGLVKEDLEKLKQILDMFYLADMPVVLTMLSLPGSRWKQNNNDKDDLRIWKSKKYQEQAAHFWKDLATELKDHPAIVGYNILNEPHLERLFDSKRTHIETVKQDEVQKMLYDFYNFTIQQIRQVDKDTPIILDSSAYSDPKTFRFFIPQEDKNLLYSFHMYEPYEYTAHQINQGKFSYPGIINGKHWNKKMLNEYMSAVIAFQKSHKIESNKILVGEFGGNRMTPGLEKYFKDLISIFNNEGWHFAFYAFREDVWDGMDYERGSKKLPWSYWQAIENNQEPILERQATYPAFSIIKEALKPTKKE